jgi:hypothetical protein
MGSMRILVVYGSKMGGTEGRAQMIGDWRDPGQIKESAALVARTADPRATP